MQTYVINVVWSKTSVALARIPVRETRFVGGVPATWEGEAPAEPQHRSTMRFSARFRECIALSMFAQLE